MPFKKGQETTRKELEKVGFKLRQGEIIQVFTRNTGKMINVEDGKNEVPEVEVVMLNTRSGKIFYRSVSAGDILHREIKVDLLEQEKEEDSL